MRAECIQAVTQAMGRKLNKQEVTGIEERITGSMTTLARQDVNAWRALSKTQQLDQAAQHAAQEIVAEASRQKANVARQVLATARVTAKWKGLVNEGRSGASAAVRAFELVDRDTSGVRLQYFGGITPVLDYLSNASRLLGWKHDQPMLRDFVREVLGEPTGNADAKLAAKSLNETTEAMRTRFNAAGGDVGKLDYAYLPQPRDALKVLKAGKEAWVNAELPRLDRSRYVKPDGSYLNSAELRAFLEASWDTISTGGLNKMEPGKSMGSGKLANRHSDARQIHYKDADSYLASMTQFGKGNPISAVQSHISALARDIALVENMGPNPNQTARLLMEHARKLDGRVRNVGPVTAEQTWNTLTGAYNHPVNVRMAEIAQGVRNVTTAVKLQGSFLSQFTDVGTLMLNAKYNQLPVWQTLKDMPKALGKGYREYANRVSLISDSMVSDMNRWADGNGGVGWTSKLANTTMKANFMQAWTDAGKRAFSVNMMGALGKITRGAWASLDNFDRVRLERAGIDQNTFDVWRAATPENWRNSQMLTPESIQAIPDAALTGMGNPQRVKDQATTKLLGYISDETDTAITSPDLMARTIQAQGTQKGTIGGELWRSTWLFKTFATSILSRQIGRIKDVNAAAGKSMALAYGASLMTSLTVLGGLSLQAKDMVTGKDPRPVNNPRFWGAAFMQGGGMGIFGDILYTAVGGNSRGGQPNWTAFAGPVFGTGFDFLNATTGNLGQLAEDKKTNFASEMIRFTRQNTPFANLWYAKAAIDHLFVNDLLEQANPGYLRRMRQRTQKEWGQDYWWRPGDKLPARAPDPAAVIGE
jgi:hypothetical protein